MLVGCRPQIAYAGALQLAQVASHGVKAVTQSRRQLARTKSSHLLARSECTETHAYNLNAGSGNV